MFDRTKKVARNAKRKLVIYNRQNKERKALGMTWEGYRLLLQFRELCGLVIEVDLEDK